jgi:cyclic pyranopterin monophosphate synthase
MEERLSHTDEQGRASMVNVGKKPEVLRKAVASGFIVLQPLTVGLVRDNTMKKGDVLTVAEIAGIQAAKKCADLIPLCHPLLLDHISVKATLKPNGVEVVATVQCSGKTGVEMEALTAVSTALLTVYDMCKAVDKSMVISNITLSEKKKGE